MSNLKERQAAYEAFVERAVFVKSLLTELGIRSEDVGSLNIDDPVKNNAFFEALEEYDANVKHIKLMQDADRIEAEAEASQGKQALTDDDWERREEQERDDAFFACLCDE